ncbi:MULTISPECIES: glycosyltransferase family 2 protein [unclassified Pedobacter]|uniref:glycosyltransferase family 2 protein n=1 Tax=unclassified Pedobacter TaxID=2628915 RepID=UPI00141FCCAA|nr:MULTISPECIES: glycosyltransferase family A protein [unclassified Pedobacter]NII81330.1 glycosyltransferase involved in cell wall biosynthesis [Pedobacter sp. SG908]NMN35336.1 glycosyltransferase involved in cell wall biosynthesis [Pedobacter sp. SG918]
MNTIALCIPAYNAEKFLPRLLDSAMKQIIPFDEILVYDDCSTDSTAKIAEFYKAITVTGDKNIGCSKGKNIIANISKSDWIHFHDADDELLPNFTTLAHKWINNQQNSEVILFNYEYRDNQTADLIDIRKFDAEALKDDPIKYAISEQINPFCGLYNKEKFLAVGGYDTDQKVLYNEDCAMHIKLAIAGFKFSVESEISIINYRIKNSMSQGNQLKCFEAQYQVMKKYAAVAPKKYDVTFGYKLWEIAGLAASHQNYQLANSCVAEARKLNVKKPPGFTLFGILCILQPYLAIKLREKYIRLFKSELR